MEDEEGSENEDSGWISSGAEYSPKAEYKQAINATEAMKFCRESRSTEMKQGFWNTKLDKQGNAIRTWQPDQRKIFINSVIAFQNLLSSECLADETYNEFIDGKDKVKGMKERLKDVFNKYAYPIFEFDRNSGGWKKTSNMFMPQIEEELLVPSPHDPKVLVNIRGGWDFKVNAYYEELVPLYDEILRELRNVIYRLKDFKKRQAFG